MPKLVHLGHEGLQGGICRCHGQRQLELLNCQILLSWTATIAILKRQRHLRFLQASLIIIVFNIETYLNYLLFDKLHELMNSNIFVILS